MRWTTVRALCRRLTVAAVTFTMVTGSLPAGAFAETLATDGTFVQTDNGQAADVDAADPAPDAGAADPTVPAADDVPTPPASEIASAAGLTGAGQTESTPAGTLATDLVEGKELAEQQKQEEASSTEATWNEELELWATSKGATGVKDEYDDGYVAGEQTPAQYYFSIDSLTNEISIEYGDAGITTLEVPSTIDDKNVVSLTGMEALRSHRSPSPLIRMSARLEAWAAAASKRSHCPIRLRNWAGMRLPEARHFTR